MYEYDSKIESLEQEIESLKKRKEEQSRKKRIRANPKYPHVVIIYDTPEAARALFDWVDDKAEESVLVWVGGYKSKTFTDIEGEIICSMNNANEKNELGFEWSDE